jgi:uncharacterized membrane protein (Fun14 family)
MQVPALLVFGLGAIIGFVIGWIIRGLKKEEEG